MQALTRVFTPVQQWLYFDAVECLPSPSLASEERLPCGSRYDHQIALFGREFQEKLGSLQVLKQFCNVSLAGFVLCVCHWLFSFSVVIFFMMQRILKSHLSIQVMFNSGKWCIKH